MRLIDGDALIESMGVSDAVKWGNKDGYQQDKSYSTLMRYEIKDYIDSQPTIDAVPVKHGKWFDAMVGELPVQVCDQCIMFFPLAYTGGGYHYCPNCGAKMDLKEEPNGTDNP